MKRLISIMAVGLLVLVSMAVSACGQQSPQEPESVTSSVSAKLSDAERKRVEELKICHDLLKRHVLTMEEGFNLFSDDKFAKSKTKIESAFEQYDEYQRFRGFEDTGAWVDHVAGNCATAEQTLDRAHLHAVSVDKLVYEVVTATSDGSIGNWDDEKWKAVDSSYTQELSGAYDELHALYLEVERLSSI